MSAYDPKGTSLDPHLAGFSTLLDSTSFSPSRLGAVMAVNKNHDEFYILDMNSGWETPPGYPNGIQQKILSGALDEANRRDTRTRLLRFAPVAMAANPSHRTRTHAGHLEPITVPSSPTAAARYWKCTISTRFDWPLTDVMSAFEGFCLCYVTVISLKANIKLQTRCS